MPLDYFNKVIGKEVFVIGGDRKGYQATLYSVGSETCTIAVHGQAHTTLKCKDIATSYGMRLNGVMLKRSDLASLCDMQRRSYLTSQLQRCTTPPPVRVPSSSMITNPSSSDVWPTWNTSSNDINVADDPLSSTDPSLSTADFSSSTHDHWTVNALDIQDNISTRAEKLQDSGPLPWFMSKEFSLQFLMYHVVFKVSPSFMGGRLHK
ncbi:hypothetical protein DFH29DRAFT_999926 [Suillus ampliporus]|nr:hypothetical protein DFH29DRAFT_999926 [Suillus ampliporus]